MKFSKENGQIELVVSLVSQSTRKSIGMTGDIEEVGSLTQASAALEQHIGTTATCP